MFRKLTTVLTTGWMVPYGWVLAAQFAMLLVFEGVSRGIIGFTLWMWLSGIVPVLIGVSMVTANPDAMGDEEDVLGSVLWLCLATVCGFFAPVVFHYATGIVSIGFAVLLGVAAIGFWWVGAALASREPSGLLFNLPALAPTPAAFGAYLYLIEATRVPPNEVAAWCLVFQMVFSLAAWAHEPHSPMQKVA